MKAAVDTSRASGGRAGTRAGRLARSVARHLLVFVLVGVWIGAVVYPDPRPFTESVSRLRNPPVDPAAIAAIAGQLPYDYQVIEDFALEYVPWAPAWTVYGLPWYFPTVAEVVRDKAGDCQARAVLLASIFEAKEMPYTLHYSFDHVWVDYPGKNFSALEDPATSFVADSGGGWLAGLPEKIDLRSVIKGRIAFHWTPMPVAQKLLILVGSALIVGHGERRLFGRIAGRSRGDRPTFDQISGRSRSFSR